MGFEEKDAIDALRIAGNKEGDAVSIATLQNGWHVANNISTCVFFVRISLNFVPKDPVDNKSVLVQVMVWHWSGNKPLPEPVMTLLIKAYMPSPGPIFCLLLGVSSDYAQPITGQVTKVTCPVIGRAQSELTLIKRQKTSPALNQNQVGTFLCCDTLSLIVSCSL